MKSMKTDKQLKDKNERLVHFDESYRYLEFT